MPEISKVITPERYSQGLTYEAYLAQMAANRERFKDNEAAFKLSAEDAKAFRDIVRRLGKVRVLAIGEDWCPDVQRGLPVMAKIAQAAGMELRIFPRDKNLDIMDLYLKDGKFRSIPVFAFLDKDMKPLCHWIERPAIATSAMEQMATELTAKKLSEEELRAERRKRMLPMAETWRQETVRELKELLNEAA